jgi:glucokinase
MATTDLTDAALLADIGATNARFALLTNNQELHPATYAVADHASPVEAARAYLAAHSREQRPGIAVIAAAGPVENGRVTMTNAAWTVDADRIRDGLGLRSVRVINDFEAVAWALPDLTATDLAQIGPVALQDSGTMVVMGPGTGFGLAALASDHDAEVVLVTEAGHATLASENRREDAIILALRERLHHISVERVLSGPGLVQLYHVIAHIDGGTAPERDSAGIVAHALAGDCETSRATLDAFCAFLGSVAGNVALTLGARRGVFIAGGIAPRFIDFLRRSSFRERFETKGRMGSYLTRIPTMVITHPFPAFVGLARLARTRATSP